MEIPDFFNRENIDKAYAILEDVIYIDTDEIIRKPIFWLLVKDTHEGGTFFFIHLFFTHENDIEYDNDIIIGSSWSYLLYEEDNPIFKNVVFGVEDVHKLLKTKYKGG